MTWTLTPLCRLRVQLLRIVVHDLLRMVDGLCVGLARRLALGAGLDVVGVLLGEEVHDFALARGALVDGEGGAELAVGADVDDVEQVDGKVLAVVADEVVGGPLLTHVVDDHLGRLPQRLVVEARLAHLEGVPGAVGAVGGVDVLVGVDDVEVLVHPQLVRVVADQHGPVLRRVRVRPDLLRDHLAQARLLGEPLAREPSDRVPADLDLAVRAVGYGLLGRHGIWSVAQAQALLQRQFALQEALDGTFFGLVIAEFSVGDVGISSWLVQKLGFTRRKSGVGCRFSLTGMH